MSVAGPQLQGLVSCTAGSFCCTPTLFGNQWNLTTLYTNTSTSASPIISTQYYTAHYNQTGPYPTAIFYPNITTSGTYDIYIDTPSATQDDTTTQRGLINLSAHLLQSSPLNATLAQDQINQNILSATSTLVYTGYIYDPLPDFVPYFAITPAPDDSTILVAQQIRFVPVSVPSVSLSTGARAGLGVGITIAVLLLFLFLYLTSCCCCCCGAKKRTKPPPNTTTLSHYQNVSRDVERDPAPAAAPTSETAEMDSTATSEHSQVPATPELMAVAPDQKIWTNRNANDQPPPYSE